MGPYHIFMYYKNRCCSTNTSEDTEKLWVKYFRR
jgi:hypothetical protein